MDPDVLEIGDIGTKAATNGLPSCTAVDTNTSGRIMAATAAAAAAAAVEGTSCAELRLRRSGLLMVKKWKKSCGRELLFVALRGFFVTYILHF